MRKSLCIAMILRSDESVAPGGTCTFLAMLGYVCGNYGLSMSMLPLQGFPHAQARNRVASMFLADEAFGEDLLWLDFGNHAPAGNALQVVDSLVKVMLTCETGCLVFPTPLRGPQDHDYSYNCFPLPGRTAVETVDLLELGALQLLKLQAAGMAFVRMRRAELARVHAWAREHGEACSYELEQGTIPGANLFGHLVEDGRELGEDVSFWRRAAKAGVHPYAVIDMPVSHGHREPGVNCPMFRDVMRLGSAQPAKGLRLVDAAGRPMGD